MSWILCKFSPDSMGDGSGYTTPIGVYPTMEAAEENVPHDAELIRVGGVFEGDGEKEWKVAPYRYLRLYRV